MKAPRKVKASNYFLIRVVGHPEPLVGTILFNRNLIEKLFELRKVLEKCTTPDNRELKLTIKCWEFKAYSMIDLLLNDSIKHGQIKELYDKGFIQIECKAYEEMKNACNSVVALIQPSGVSMMMEVSPEVAHIPYTPIIGWSKLEGIKSRQKQRK